MWPLGAAEFAASCRARVRSWLHVMMVRLSCVGLYAAVDQIATPVVPETSGATERGKPRLLRRR
jgi:hypothetical protein